MHQQSSRPVALVAGASRGLGLLIARELASRGHDVAICARDEETLRVAAQQIGDGLDVRVHHFVCDVRSEQQVTATVAEVERELGPVDVAVFVAGVIQVGPLAALQHHHFRDSIDVMLWGPINLAMAVVPGMVGRGQGRFGVVTSVGARVSPPRLLPYNTAKFGAAGFTEGLSAELAGTGVTATTIVPGLMRTGSHQRASFFGDAAKQYAWFGPAASLPLLTMGAERAARIMVDGVLRGKPVVTVSLMSHLATRVHGLAPGLTVRLMGVMSRLLPAGTNAQTVEGLEVRRGGGVVSFLTTLGDRAAERFNERRRD